VKQLVLVSDGDDWQGWYVDGKLRFEGPDTYWPEVMKLLDVDYRYEIADWEWISERGVFPPNLDEVKLEEK
jgi:hypothetical protein